MEVFGPTVFRCGKIVGRRDNAEEEPGQARCGQDGSEEAEGQCYEAFRTRKSQEATAKDRIEEKGQEGVGKEKRDGKMVEIGLGRPDNVIKVVDEEVEKDHQRKAEQDGAPGDPFPACWLRRWG